MFRKAILPVVAALALGGCATYGGYGDGYYGNGGYYGNDGYYRGDTYGYGQSGSAGYNRLGYDRYGRYGYYDRYGRFIEVRQGGYYGGYGSGGYYGGYGYPGGYYGGYGYPGGYYGGYSYPPRYPYPNTQPRPPRPDRDDDQDGNHQGDDGDRKPIWRDLRRIGERAGRPRVDTEGEDFRPRRVGPAEQPTRTIVPMPRPMSTPTPMTAPSPSRTESRGSMGGRLLRQAERAATRNPERDDNP